MTDIDTAALRATWSSARYYTIDGFLWATRHADALLDEVDRLRAIVARVEEHRAAWASRATGEIGQRVHADLTAALTPDTKETDRG